MTSGNDLLFGNAAIAMSFDVKAPGKDGAKWEGPNHTVRGVITDFGANHRRELINDRGSYRQGELLYWQADRKLGTTVTERPVKDPVLTIQTDFENWEGAPSTFDGTDGDDDGLRRVFLTGRAKTSPGSSLDAVRAACAAKKIRKIEVGMVVSITCTTTGKAANRNLNPPKVYEAEIWRADASDLPDWAKGLTEDEGNAPAEDDEDLFA